MLSIFFGRRIARQIGNKKKSEDKFATELIQREYTEKVLKTICEQRKLIEKFVKKYNEKSVLDVVNKISEPKLEKIKMYVKDDMAYIYVIGIKSRRK